MAAQKTRIAQSVARLRAFHGLLSFKAILKINAKNKAESITITPASRHPKKAKRLAANNIRKGKQKSEAKNILPLFPAFPPFFTLSPGIELKC